VPLSQSTLAQDLERVLDAKPASSADAASAWANAYQTYATSALSSTGTLPIGAPALFGMLLGAFQGGLSALSSVSAAAIIAQGIMSYWQAMTWLGPAAAGVTSFPGNVTLASALGAAFSDLGDKSARDKASDFANAFDAGARAVLVSDQPFAPGPPVVGPIM
jgi:hypothetical protein